MILVSLAADRKTLGGKISTRRMILFGLLFAAVILQIARSILQRIEKFLNRQSVIGAKTRKGADRDIRSAHFDFSDIEIGIDINDPLRQTLRFPNPFQFTGDFSDQFEIATRVIHITKYRKGLKFFNDFKIVVGIFRIFIGRGSYIKPKPYLCFADAAWDMIK